MRDYKRIRGRPTRREEIEGFNAADRFYAAAAGVPPKNQIPLPPKRNKVLRPSDQKPAIPLEKAVNDDIYSTAKRLNNGPLWRNNHGTARYGNHEVRYGVGPRGASDWIGYRRLLITADYVGKTIAQFVAIEAKRPGETAEPHQQVFIDRVTADGGIAGCVTSSQEAEEILTKW